MAISVDVITKPSYSDIVITDATIATKILLAIGENKLITITPTYAIIEKVNLKTGDISYSKDLQTLLPNSVDIENNFQVVQQRRAKGGNIAFTLLYVKDTESEGSRHLFMRDFVIDPSDLSVVSYGDEVQLNGDLLDKTPWGGPQPFYISRHTLFCGHWRKNNLLLIDLNAKYVKITPNYTPSGNYASVPHAILRDRTTNNLVLFMGTHYWITGSYGYLSLINPRDLTQIEANTSFDPGSGAFLQHMYYRDSTGKVRLLVFGCSGGYPYTTYTSKWNSIYVDNDTIVGEFVVTANGNYGTFEAGNRFPHVLGVRSDGRLQLIVYGKSWGGVSSFGVSCLDVNDTLGDPANLVENSVSIDTSELSAHMRDRIFVFLLEDDWNYYVWGGTQTIDGSPTNVVFRVSGVPDLPDPDPYGYILVPKTGLIPTNLALTAKII